MPEKFVYGAFFLIADPRLREDDEGRSPPETALSLSNGRG